VRRLKESAVSENTRREERRNKENESGETEGQVPAAKKENLNKGGRECRVQTQRP